MTQQDIFKSFAVKKSRSPISRYFSTVLKICILAIKIYIQKPRE